MYMYIYISLENISNEIPLDFFLNLGSLLF